MRTIAKTKDRASALIITLLVIFLIAVATGIAMNLTTVTVRQTDSSRDFAALRSAAEGAVDFGYGVWAKKINTLYRPVANSELTAALGGTPPPFPPFSYAMPLQITGTDQYGCPTTAAGTPPPTRINLDSYPGWLGRNTSYLASARMQGTFLGRSAPVTYGVKRAINYTVVPLFQATAFFEDTLELYKTAPMTIGGLVHTNSKAYVSSSSATTPSLTFTGNLSYVGGYVDSTWVDSAGVTRDAPPEAWTWNGYSANSSFQPAYTNGGIDQQAHAVGRIEPLGADSTALLHPPVDAAGNPTNDLNPNDDAMRELIEPPNTYVDPLTQKITTTSSYTDPQTIADRRLYNKAGIRIRINGSSYTVTTANGTTLTARQVTALKAALSQQTITDRREAKTVDLTTLDVSKAKANITTGGPIEPGALAAPSFNNILYIDDISSTGYTDPKGIRLINGSVLPNEGLTVASQNSVYIQGDYNTTNQSTRGSAAVFADAVTILSNAWKDQNSGSSLSARDASDTTVNTAIVAGFLPSGWTNPKTGAEYGYSGGLNNFPRFLEDWSSKKFNYTGSMIELFTSQIATGEWDTGAIYVPPNRIWNFDSNFVDNPPPGSLDAVYIGRGALARF